VITVRIHQDSERRRATIGRFRIALNSDEYAWPSPEKGKEIPAAVLGPLARLKANVRRRSERPSPAFEWASPEAQAELNHAARLD